MDAEPSSMEKRQMRRRLWIGIPLIALVIIVISTLFFGGVETKRFSAYAACRKVAMETKGYSIWEHTKTVQYVFISAVYFVDMTNELGCAAVGVGPFWHAIGAYQTIVGCGIGYGDGTYVVPCREGYFGVSP
jgi:hypothetical protein